MLFDGFENILTSPTLTPVLRLSELEKRQKFCRFSHVVYWMLLTCNFIHARERLPYALYLDSILKSSQACTAGSIIVIPWIRLWPVSFTALMHNLHPSFLLALSAALKRRYWMRIIRSLSCSAPKRGNGNGLCLLDTMSYPN